MSIYRRLAYAVVGLAALIFVLLPLSLLSIAHSNYASEWLVSVAKPWLPQSASFESFEGALVGPFRIEQLQVNLDQFDAQFEYLTLDWNLWQLFNGKLDVSSLTLGAGEVRVRQNSTATEANKPTDLQSVSVTLPLALSLDNVELKKSWIFINDLPEQQIALTTALSLSTGGELSVNSFTLNHQYLSVSTSADANLSYPFDYELSSKIKLHSPDYPVTQLTLASRGDVKKLQGQFSLADSIDITGQFSASELLEAREWSTELIAQQSKLNAWLVAFGIPELPTVSIDGRLALAGDPDTMLTAKPQLTVTYQNLPIAITGEATVSTSELKLQPLRVRIDNPPADTEFPAIGGNAVISGTLTRRDSSQLDLKLALDEVLYKSTQSQGEILLTGPIDQLMIEADTTTTITTDSENTVSTYAKALLQPSQLMLQQLRISDTEYAKGITGTATIDWENALRINSDLQGQLFNQPFSLLADLTYDQPYITVKKLAAEWRQSTIRAEGRMAPGSQLNINAQLNELKRLPLPIAATGDLQLTATIEGDITAPWFDTTVTSNQLTIAGTEINNSSLSVVGDLKQHQLSGSLTAFATTWQLQATNKLSTDNITTELTTFSADHESLQPFQLQQPASLYYQWSDPSLSIDSLCLVQTQLSEPACITANTEANTTSIAVDIPATDVAILNPLLAPAPFSLDGTLRASANASWNWNRSALTALDARVLSNSLVLNGLEESVAFDQVQLSLTPDEEQFTLKLDAHSDDIGLLADGAATLQNLSPTTALDGQITTTLSDIGLLQVVVPAVASAEGQLDAKLAFSGSLQKLTLRPTAEAQINELVLTETGTLIKQAQLNIAPSPEQSALFQLTSSGKIGSGDFSLQGAYDMATTAFNAELQGNNLKVVDTPKVTVSVSPDLNVEFANRKLSVTGAVDVPSANISPPQLSSVQRPSEDVVIKQQPKDETPPIQTYTNITLSLGDNVNVNAYGFEGQLQGKLTITQADAGVPRGNGSIGVKAGSYEVYGQELTIDRGELVYNGGPLSNPSLNLRVVRNLPNTTTNPERVGARVQGTLQEPTLALFSEPPMPDSSILSYLMFGRAPNSSAESSNLELQAALLLTGDVTNSFTQGLKDTFGFDEVAIDSSTSDVNDTSLYIGKYLTPRLYIKYGIGLVESTSSFFLRYQLTDHLWIESTSSTESQGGDLIYSIEK